MSTLDYHIHTIVSTDADYTPEEIIRMAQENGVKTLAIYRSQQRWQRRRGGALG